MFMWIGKNAFKSHDFVWLKSFGGALGGGHPPAGFFNGGEKVYFWIIFFGGIAMTVSGFFLLFPNLGTVRETMQFWHLILASIGTEGALEGMVSGEVDEGFAKQHHSIWYEEVKDSASAPKSAPAGDVSTASPT